MEESNKDGWGHGWGPFIMRFFVAPIATGVVIFWLIWLGSTSSQLAKLDANIEGIKEASATSNTHLREYIKACTDPISGVSQKLEGIESRLSKVEGRIDGIAKTTDATNDAVRRLRSRTEFLPIRSWLLAVATRDGAQVSRVVLLDASNGMVKIWDFAANNPDDARTRMASIWAIAGAIDTHCETLQNLGAEDGNKPKPLENVFLQCSFAFSTVANTIPDIDLVGKRFLNSQAVNIQVKGTSENYQDLLNLLRTNPELLMTAG